MSPHPQRYHLCVPSYGGACCACGWMQCTGVCVSVCLFAAEDQRHALVKTSAAATPHQMPDDSFRTPHGECGCVGGCGGV